VTGKVLISQEGDYDDFTVSNNIKSHDFDNMNKKQKTPKFGSYNNMRDGARKRGSVVPFWAVALDIQKSMMKKPALTFYSILPPSPLNE
jgi:hypothetical protein